MLSQEVILEKTITPKRPLPIGAGQYSSGRSDISTQAEKLLFSGQLENIQKQKEI